MTDNPRHGVTVERIRNKQAKIAVIGMGYVGLPLMELLARSGFTVLGYDVDEAKVAMVNGGKSYVGDVAEESLESLVKAGKMEATDDHKRLESCDVIFICVPTPFTRMKDPDISYVKSAARDIADVLRRGQLVVLKSTTFPETTEKVVLPILASTGLKVGTDYHLSFSPERIDPGNKAYTVFNTPTVVGGVSDTCTELTAELLESCGVKAVPVSSPRVAEMSKLLENIFRSVNIALVNELARLCDRMGDIDIWEVIDAASSKPFGYMPFYPGPGIGGHCILVDPYYLSWKAREFDFHTNFIELAAETNEEMPYYVAQKVLEALSSVGICASEAKVLILGIAFKRNVADTRNSPAMKIMSLLKGRVAAVYYSDPYVERVRIEEEIVESVPLAEKTLHDSDCVVIATDHDVYDYEWVVSNSRAVVDTRNATRARDRRNVFKLGGGSSQR